MRIAGYQNQGRIQAATAKQKFAAIYGKGFGAKKSSMSFTEVLDSLSVSKGQETKRGANGLRDLTNAEAAHLKEKYQQKFDDIKQRELDMWERIKQGETFQGDEYNFDVQRTEVQDEFMTDLKDMGILTEEEHSVLTNYVMPVILGAKTEAIYNEKGEEIARIGVGSIPPEDDWSKYDQEDPASYYKFMLHLCKSGRYGYDTPEWQAKIPIYEKGILLVSHVFQ